MSPQEKPALSQFSPTELGEYIRYYAEKENRNGAELEEIAKVSDQAKLKGNSPEADALFAEAAHKYAEAIRIKPDKHEVFNNWGNALSAQAKLKGNSPEADALFAEAARKYAEAIRIKPDMHEAFFNLACLSALHAEINKAIEHLSRWRDLAPNARKKQLDEDSDFDRIRDQPAFIAFRADLAD
jgi:tetratricopeptide (TPR) repeat protein